HLHPFLFSLIKTPTTDISTLSLHDALPIFGQSRAAPITNRRARWRHARPAQHFHRLRRNHWIEVERDFPLDRLVALSLSKRRARSEEHTSELQSRGHLVCRLLLEKKK